MRKNLGIISFLVGCLFQILGYFIWFLLMWFVVQIDISHSGYIRAAMMSSFVVSNMISLIFLGFYLNKKYQRTLTYWRFIRIGIPVSTIFVSIFLFLDSSILGAIEFLICPIITCLIIALFHKRYKFTHKVTNNTLDSNIVNRE